MARLDGRFPRLVDKLARVQLLVFDDWGTHSLKFRTGHCDRARNPVRQRAHYLTSRASAGSTTIPFGALHSFLGKSF
jgi:hypothetical protein